MHSAVQIDKPRKLWNRSLIHCKTQHLKKVVVIQTCASHTQGNVFKLDKFQGLLGGKLGAGIWLRKYRGPFPRFSLNLNHLGL